MTPTPSEVRHRALDTSPNDTVTAADDGTGRIDHDLDLSGSEDFKDHKVIGIDGKWYDITNFIDKHPGGPVITHFIGKDATAVFKAYGHDEQILKHRKVIGTYSTAGRHPADAEFEELVKDMKQKGYYETDWFFYTWKFSICAFFWTMALLSLKYAQPYGGVFFAGVSTAFFFQQSAFIMHEFMHCQIMKTIFWNRFFGVVFGTSGFGISAHWWRDEHIVHHALTNVVDYKKRWADPQMLESVWAQNKKLFPLFSTKLEAFLISIQHITFVPIVVLIGRFEIVIDSMRVERRWYEWVGAAVHWTWMFYFWSHIPTWWQVLGFYLTVAWVEGWFHFQLILSHYCKMFMTIDEFHSSSWYIYQILSNMNITTPWWQDWYYGGLNYHIEHHLFPRMSRKYYREASVGILKICKKYNIDYDTCSFGTALVKTLTDLKKTGTHFKLDPR